MRFTVTRSLPRQPLGNLFLSSTTNSRDSGLGLLSALSDEVIIDLLETYCSPADLCRLAQVSKAMYAFAHHDPLWRALIVRDYPGNFTYSQSWKFTYIAGLYLD